MTDNQKVRVGSLSTIGRIILEMGRIYRATRRSEITTQDGMRFVQMLTAIRTAVESGDIEVRLAALEQRYQDARLAA